MTFSWEHDEFNKDGKLLLLYRHQRIIDEKIVKKDNIVLDIGGWGKLAYRLYQEECKIVLININKKECEGIKKKYNVLDVIIGDARMLPFKDSIFDTITCFETLEHITINKENVIKEIFRILKYNGFFTGTIPIPGKCHSINDKSITFIYPNDLKVLIEQYTKKLYIEETGSINKNNEPSSWYFYSIKEQQKI